MNKENTTFTHACPPWRSPRLTGLALLLATALAGGCGSDNKPGATGTGGSPAGTGTGGSGAGLGGGGMDGSQACGNDNIEVTDDITTDTTWACNSYVMKGRIHVLNGATLTIAAGSTVRGDGGPDNAAALISTREGRLVAVGTPTKPIVFTSANPPGSRMPGDTFAGIAMLGKARINNGSMAPGGYLQTVIEGIEATDTRGMYGGADDTHDCGELRYVRVEFGGFIIGADNELNGITLGGCGSATKISHVQVHRGLDDGVEVFGGTVSMDHIVISGVDDDALDWDNGWRGGAQFVVVHQAYGKGDKGFESDNLGTDEDAEPRSKPELWNFTMIGEAGQAKIGMHLREGTRGILRNFIVLNFGGGALDVDAKQVVPETEWPTHLSVESSVFFGGMLGKAEMAGTSSDNDMGFDEAAKLQEPARMNVFDMDPMLTSVDIASPNYVPTNAAAVSNKATPGAGFDATATYAGAVAPDETAPWWTGWTAFPEN